MKHVRYIVHAALALLLVACASSGTDFRIEDAQKVKIGMTEAEVVQIMGSKPSDVQATAGSELWRWIHVATPDGSPSKSFAVKFVGGKVVWMQR
jgi:hypothetical protein